VGVSILLIHKDTGASHPDWNSGGDKHFLGDVGLKVEEEIETDDEIAPGCFETIFRPCLPTLKQALDNSPEYSDYYRLYNTLKDNPDYYIYISR